MLWAWNQVHNTDFRRSAFDSKFGRNGLQVHGCIDIKEVASVLALIVARQVQRYPFKYFKL